MLSGLATTLPAWVSVATAIRVALGVWAVVLVAHGSFAGALSLVATIGVTALPRYLGVPRGFATAFTVAMALNALGSVAGWFYVVPGFNALVHFALPIAGAPAAYFALVHLGVFPDPRTTEVRYWRLGVFVSVTFAALALETVFEVYEWSSDQLIGTELQLGNNDTMTDLFAGGLGGLVGGWLSLVWLERTATLPVRARSWT